MNTIDDRLRTAFEGSYIAAPLIKAGFTFTDDALADFIVVLAREGLEISEVSKVSEFSSPADKLDKPDHDQTIHAIRQVLDHFPGTKGFPALDKGALAISIAANLYLTQNPPTLHRRVWP